MQYKNFKSVVLFVCFCMSMGMCRMHAEIDKLQEIQEVLKQLNSSELFRKEDIDDIGRIQVDDFCFSVWSGAFWGIMNSGRSNGEKIKAFELLIKLGELQDVLGNEEGEEIITWAEQYKKCLERKLEVTKRSPETRGGVADADKKREGSEIPGEESSPRKIQKILAYDA